VADGCGGWRMEAEEYQNARYYFKILKKYYFVRVTFLN
jgi:hypothetical protein